jgi:hypothetical protein
MPDFPGVVTEPLELVGEICANEFGDAGLRVRLLATASVRTSNSGEASASSSPCLMAVHFGGRSSHYARGYRAPGAFIEHSLEPHRPFASWLPSGSDDALPHHRP